MRRISIIYYLLSIIYYLRSVAFSTLEWILLRADRKQKIKNTKEKRGGKAVSLNHSVVQFAESESLF